MDPKETPETPADQAANEDAKGNEEPKQEPQAPSQDDPKPAEEPQAQKPAEEPKKFTKRERLEHAREKIEKQLEDLDAEDDDKPLTVGEFRRMQREESRQDAIELAETSIEDEDERDEVINALQSKVVPSGSPQEDLQTARDLVNARKNRQQLEDQARKQDPKKHGNPPAAPGAGPEDVFTPTEEEQVFMKPPYNLTKEDIIAKRNKASANQE